MKMRLGSSWPVHTMKLTGLSPLLRRCLLLATDALLLPLAVWLSFWLRLAQPFHPNFVTAGSWLLSAVLLVGLPLFAFTGQYQGLTRYVGSAALYRLAARNGLLVLLLAGLGVMLEAADAASQQLDSVVVVTHEFHRSSAFWPAGRLAQLAFHSA